MKSHTRHLVLLDGHNEWFVVVHILHVRAFITFVICQICKCLCLNNDLLWGTSWRLQAAKLQWKPQLWDLWSGWGAVYCTLFVDSWTILVCCKRIQTTKLIFTSCLWLRRTYRKWKDTLKIIKKLKQTPARTIWYRSLRENIHWFCSTTIHFLSISHLTKERVLSSSNSRCKVGQRQTWGWAGCRLQSGCTIIPSPLSTNSREHLHLNKQ